MLTNAIEEGAGDRLREAVRRVAFRSAMEARQNGGGRLAEWRSRSGGIELGERLRYQIAERIRERAVDGLRDRIELAVRDAIEETLRERLRGAVRGAIAEQAGDDGLDTSRLADAIRTQLAESLRSRLGDGVRERIADPLRARLAEAVESGVTQVAMQS
jgi:hypothetical protein